MSFNESFTDFEPESFPLPLDLDRVEVLIAPFWDDSDNSVAGQVFYRFSDDASLLTEIATNISDAFEVDFSPVAAFVVTWNGLPQYEGPSDVVS